MVVSCSWLRPAQTAKLTSFYIHPQYSNICRLSGRSSHVFLGFQPTRSRNALFPAIKFYYFFSMGHVNFRLAHVRGDSAARWEYLRLF